MKFGRDRYVGLRWVLMPSKATAILYNVIISTINIHFSVSHGARLYRPSSFSFSFPIPSRSTAKPLVAQVYNDAGEAIPRNDVAAPPKIRVQTRPATMTASSIAMNEPQTPAAIIVAFPPNKRPGPRRTIAEATSCATSHESTPQGRQAWIRLDGSLHDVS